MTLDTLAGAVALWLSVGIVISVILYFLPTGIALLRRHHNALAIFVLNLLAGWTIIGWFGALAWSVTGRHGYGRLATGEFIPTGAISADGQWMWDGQQWVAAPRGPASYLTRGTMSPDGQWVWDGLTWVPTATWRPGAS